MAVLKGDLSAFGLPELFQHLSQNKKFGILRIYFEANEKKLVFQPHGITLLAAGDRKSKEIGKLLVYHRHITLSQLNEALNSQKKSKTKAIFGKTLIDIGLVSREQINKIMLDQVKEEIYDLFTWEKANFEFLEDPKEVEKLNLDPNLFIDKENISGTILEAMQRIDEWKLIREEVASLSTIYVPANLSLEEIANLRSEEALNHILNSEPADNSANLQIFSLIDGRNTVEDIIQKSYMPRFEVFVEICNLLRQNFIRPALPFEVLTFCQPMLDKVKKAQIYAVLYPNCVLDPHQISCTLEIIKYFQENPSFRSQFPGDLKKEILKMAEVYLQGKDLESARFLLRVSLPQFNTDEEYLKIYLDILLKLQESEEALNLIFPLAKRLTDQGEFRKFTQYYNLAKQFNATNHPIFKKIQALRTSPEKKRKIFIGVAFFVGMTLLLGGYYHFYRQSQQNAVEFKEKLQKELKALVLNYQKQIEGLLNEEKYDEVMNVYQESLRLQSRLEVNRQDLGDFLLKNSLFFVQETIQEVNTEIDQIRFTLKTQIANIQTMLNTKRGELFEELNKILSEGSLNRCFQKLQLAEPLLKAAIKYHISYNDLNSKPEFDNNYYPEGELLPDKVKGSIRVFFDSLANSIETHKLAKSKLEDAQQLWSKGISSKSYVSFQTCLALYKELYNFPDTDFHRKSQVPLLVLPTFDEELEPELAKMKDFPPQLKIKVENAQFEQIITLEEKNSFLCSYPLPVKKNSEKPNILLEVTYPGFKSIQEKIFSTDLQISYPYPLRRKHIEFSQYPNVIYLIPCPEKQCLILVHNRDGVSHLIRAINLEGQELWKFSFTGTLKFSPILYKDLLFVASTLELETAKTNCTLYDLATLPNVSPKEINTIQVEGGIRSQACFFPELEVICFSGIMKNSKDKVVPCLRFYSMGNLSEIAPPVSLTGAVTTGIAHDAKDNFYFGSGNTFSCYSLNEKKFLWQKTRKSSGTTEDKSTHKFLPFVNQKDVLVALNTSNNSGYLYIYKESNQLPSPSSLNNAVNFPPQLHSGFVAVTTTYEALIVQLDSMTILQPTYSSSVKIASSAISDGKYMYFFNEAGEVLSVNMKAELAWKYPIKKISKEAISQISGQPCILQNYLIFPFKTTLVLFELLQETE